LPGAFLFYERNSLNFSKQLATIYISRANCLLTIFTNLILFNQVYWCLDLIFEEDMMKKICTVFSTFAILILLFSLSFGRSNFTGYSGAPGSSGLCASSCHGTGGGTIQVSGFPNEYTPGLVYTVSVTHNGGSTIRQFNGSCRIGTGSQNAGVIAAGTRSVTYNASGETNGIHLSSTSQNDCTFQWTAPQAGTETVRLYVAGQQGGSSGPNTSLTLVATEQQSGIDDDNLIPKKSVLISNYPNPFNGSTILRFNLPSSGKIGIDIYNVVGQKMESIYSGAAGAGEFSIAWDASRFPSGIYFAKLIFGDKSFNHRITLLK
jgi:hypothetical protein